MMNNLLRTDSIDLEYMGFICLILVCLHSYNQTLGKKRKKEKHLLEYSRFILVIFSIA